MKRMTIVAVTIMALSILAGPGRAQMAPGFALQDNNGTMVYRSSFKGNLIVSFFASYCKPCKKEMPQIIELEQKYGKDRGITLVFIAVDVSDKDGDAREKAAKFMTAIGVSRSYLVDLYQVVIEKYNPKKVVPATFLINRAGLIVFQEIGFHEETVARLEKAIQGLQ